MKSRNHGLCMAIVAFVATTPLFADTVRHATNEGVQLVVRRHTVTRGESTPRSIEGKVTAVNTASDGYIITMSGGEMLRARPGVPVRYRGDRYEVADLEAGDQIRASVARVNAAREYAVRAIDVIASVSADPSDEVPMRGEERRPRRDMEMDRGRYDDSASGEVISVNTRNASFLMTSRDGRDIRVDAFHADGADLSTLRSGDMVRVDGTTDASGVLRAVRIDRVGHDDGDMRRYDWRRDGERRDRWSRRPSDRDDDSKDDDDDDDDEDED